MGDDREPPYPFQYRGWIYNIRAGYRTNEAGQSVDLDTAACIAWLDTTAKLHPAGCGCGRHQ